MSVLRFAPADPRGSPDTWRASIGRVRLKGVDSVVRLPVFTKLDLDAAAVISAAMQHGLRDVVLYGIDLDGREYYATNIAHNGSVLWMVERMKRELMEHSEHTVGNG